ncbi:uncharacterized protein HD556DRAFT_1205975, partial [Suillus plorans]
LPFLTQDHATVSSVAAISFLVSSLAKSTSIGAWDFDASLSVLHRTKRTVWYSQNIGDFQTYSLYSLDDDNKIHTMLRIPQHYYVPARICEIYRPRSFGKRPKKDNPKNKYVLTFKQDNVFLQARVSLATLYVKLLNVQKFFFGERPMTLNIHIASHVLLLLNLPFPDQFIRSILR